MYGAVVRRRERHDVVDRALHVEPVFHRPARLEPALAVADHVDLLARLRRDRAHRVHDVLGCGLDVAQREVGQAHRAHVEAHLGQDLLVAERPVILGPARGAVHEQHGLVRAREGGGAAHRAVAVGGVGLERGADGGRGGRRGQGHGQGGRDRIDDTGASLPPLRPAAVLHAPSVGYGSEVVRST